MDNKGLQISTTILDIANLVAFFFSFQLEKGVISALSILAVLAFSSIWFYEHLRNRQVDNINLEKPELSHTDIMLLNSRSKSLVEDKIEKFNQKQIQKIKYKNDEYLGYEKWAFGFGAFFTVVIVLYLIFSS